MVEVQEPVRLRDPSGAIGRNIEPFLLLELLRSPSYGRGLIRQLADKGFRRASAEPGVVYKVLRSLEDTGSISSTWDTHGSGPARRYYQITPQGEELLRHRVDQLRRYADRIEQLLTGYSLLTGEGPTDHEDLETARPEAGHDAAGPGANGAKPSAGGEG